MAIISEVNALCDLVGKASNFVTYLHDGWYKGKAELNAFPAKVSILHAKQAQWSSLLQKFGMSEDEHLKPLVKEAVQILDKEVEHVQRMQKSCILRCKMRAFPGQLTSILDNVLAIVEAGPQLLATRIETSELLEKSSARTPVLLPFRSDHKYVPLSGLVLEVEKALDDAQGPRVVTLYGEPGMGKSSLSKYLAVQYQAKRKKRMDASSSRTAHFRDGVFYVSCGKGAIERIEQLQWELLESLGCGVGSPPTENDLNLPTYANKLRCHLAEKKLLIILDDLWDRAVLEKLLVPGEDLKYLVTSQNRGIWDDAVKIKLENPTMEEAKQILANYTEGFPTDGKFPDSIQGVTYDITEKVEYHPLALANVGLTINRSRATSIDEWSSVKESLHDYLDDNDLDKSPTVYERTYPLKVGATMMLMVDSLPLAARRLLFLVGLLEGPEVPEVLFKFLAKFLESTQFKFKLFNSYMNYLQDRSLVEFRERGETSYMGAHSLRTHYIREKNAAALRSIAEEVLDGSSHHVVRLTEGGDAAKILVTIMGAMYYAKPFRDVVAKKLLNQFEIINDGVIPQSMGSGLNAIDLVKRTRGQKRRIEGLVLLLNPDGARGWKQQVHEYAQNIIIRFICRGELDDKSMAHLLQLPQTTSTALVTLDAIFMFGANLKSAFYDQNRTFSDAHPETMKILLAMLSNNSATSSRRAAVVDTLEKILAYEREDIILRVAEKWVEFLAKDSDPTLQSAVATVLSSQRIPSRASVLVGEFPGVLERLFILLVYGEDFEVQKSAMKGIHGLSRIRSTAVKIVGISSALEILIAYLLMYGWNSFDDNLLHDTLSALHHLSSVPENRDRFGALLVNLLEGFSELLASPSVEDDTGHVCWQSGPTPVVSNDECEIIVPIMQTRVRKRLKVSFARELNCTLALKILGNLALAKDLQKTIASWPALNERLQVLQREGYSSALDISFSCLKFCLNAPAARALTILDPLHINPTLTAEIRPSPWASYAAYMGRAEAHREMKMYSEALTDVEMAHHHLLEIPHEDRYLYSPFWRELRELRQQRIFLKAMLEDYAGAMIDANSTLEDPAYCEERPWEGYTQTLAERGVLHRLSGDLSAALVDLDRAIQLNWSPYYHFLKHRGIVKHLMGDDAGARVDAESVEREKAKTLKTGTSEDALGHANLLWITVSYMGFTL